MDHVPIMLRKVVEPPPGILNDEQLLKRILDEVRAIKAKKGESYSKMKNIITDTSKSVAAKPKKKTVKKVEAA
jgi:hypothetical protein